MVQGLEPYRGITFSQVSLREGKDCNKTKETLGRQ